MEKEPKFLSTYDVWTDVNKQLFEDCENFLIETLKGQENNEVGFDDDSDYLTYVTYDGGNHPEYAANPYSEVRNVYLKDYQVFLDIEDDDEYPISRINSEEIYNVASSVYELLNNKDDDEEL